MTSIHLYSSRLLAILHVMAAVAITITVFFSTPPAIRPHPHAFSAHFGWMNKLEKSFKGFKGTVFADFSVQCAIN